jgi:hypothetical protein
MKFSVRIFLIPSFLLFFQHVQAQNFNYSLTKDSIQYQPLATATVVAAEEDWTNKKFNLKLPFQFNCAGTSTDSLTIESNGFISFGKNTNLALVAFNNFASSMDSTGMFVSRISSVITGNAGNRIVKIEYKNLAVNAFSATDYFNYQVWLYENGNKIEYHIGPNPYAALIIVAPAGTDPNTDQYIDTGFRQLIGLINRKMDTTDKGYLITGNPSFPNGKRITGDTELSYLSNIPSAGNIYTFIPSF